MIPGVSHMLADYKDELIRLQVETERYRHALRKIAAGAGPPYARVAREALDDEPQPDEQRS